MSISLTVEDYLTREGVKYETVVHSPTQDAAHTAQTAGVSGDRVAKAVVLEDADGYLMAVIPASHRLDLQAAEQELNRHLSLTDECDLVRVFVDCEPGAIPVLGQAYGVDTVVDRSLIGSPEVFFEGGDHLSLVRVSGSDFRKLMTNVPQRDISHHL
jgi:Ala-tRNA(Pro) deacylase